MVNKRGQHLLQLHEKSLARGVAVGVHVELNGTGTVPAVSSGANHRGTVPKVLQVLEHLLVLLREQRSRWDGDGLVTSGEHGPAIGAAFGDVELVAWL